MKRNMDYADEFIREYVYEDNCCSEGQIRLYYNIGKEMYD